MATSKSIERFRAAAKSYLNDEQFSDFTIVCEEKEFKVHRCFISAHSPFFKTCCSGMFEESKSSKVELKEELTEVVECMIEFFYTFDYDDTIKADPKPNVKSGRPACSVQMNAHVYAIAEKYQVEDLKSLALEKFETSVIIENRINVLAATWTVYKDIKLPPGDSTLQCVLLDFWCMGAPDWFGDEDYKETKHIASFMEDVPEFVSLVFEHMAVAFKTGTLRMQCAQCKRKETIHRSKARAQDFKCKGCDSVQAEPHMTLQGHLGMRKFW